MPRGCCDDGEPTPIKAGAGIRVTGSGTTVDPYKITSVSTDIGAFLTVRDTPTVDLTLIGSGNAGDPFELRASSTLRLSDLTDIQDPTGVPLAGESPVYVGTYPLGHWEFNTLPPAPAGSVNVGAGISGTGAAAAPIRVVTSGTWGSGPLAGLGTDTTIGQPIYVDANNALRAAPLPAAASPLWANIQNKPSTFTPSAHTHVASDIAVAEQRKLDAGKVLGKTITTTTTSSSPPANAATGDLWFFPRGS